jgi:hypothetical protein
MHLNVRESKKSFVFMTSEESNSGRTPLEDKTPLLNRKLNVIQSAHIATDYFIK